MACSYAVNQNRNVESGLLFWKSRPKLSAMSKHNFSKLFSFIAGQSAIPQIRCTVKPPGCLSVIVVAQCRPSPQMSRLWVCWAFALWQRYTVSNWHVIIMANTSLNFGFISVFQKTPSSKLFGRVIASDKSGKHVHSQFHFESAVRAAYMQFPSWNFMHFHMWSNCISGTFLAFFQSRFFSSQNSASLLTSSCKINAFSSFPASMSTSYRHFVWLHWQATAGCAESPGA